MKPQLPLAILAAAILASAAAQAAVIMSDNFDRPDSTDLGTTAQGYSWGRVNWYGGLTPAITSSAMAWTGATGWNQYNPVAMADAATNVKDFQLDVYVDPGSTYNSRGLNISFRVKAWETATTGNQGYNLNLRQDSADSYYITLTDSTGTQLQQSYQRWWGTIGQVSLVANGNNFQVFSHNDATPVINYTDLSGSPSTTASGYFTFNVGNADDPISFDNLVVSTIPEPALASLLALGAAPLALRRRRN